MTLCKGTPDQYAAFEWCVGFLAGMIEKYSGKVELPVFSAGSQTGWDHSPQGGISMSREKQTPTPIRFSAAEVLTYVASTGDQQGGIEIRYEDENIWLTQKTIPA